MSHNKTKIYSVNECDSNIHNCHTNAECTNTSGSYYCNCTTGYVGNGTTCGGRIYIYRISDKMIWVTISYKYIDTIVFM